MVGLLECDTMDSVHKSVTKLKGRPVVGSGAGLNGSYLINSLAANDNDKPEWIFKPRSEEAEVSGETLKSGAIKGTSCVKEVAAYYVDHEGFSGVPETRAINASVQLEASKYIMDFGSLQRFVAHDGSCEEYGSSLFEVDNIHRIALLDLRIANCDRHEGNLLAVREGSKLRAVPIDHGYCLPNWRYLSDLYFCWSSWRQANVPFSEATKQYIAGQKPFMDIANLLDIGVDHDSVITYLVCSIFVQSAVAGGLSLAQIARAMQRTAQIGLGEPSQFEQLISQAAIATGFSNFRFSGRSDWNLPIVGRFLKHFFKSCMHFLSRPCQK